MRMIRPTTLSSANIDSTTAEAENLTHWEPEGLPYFERDVQAIDYSSQGVLAIAAGPEGSFGQGRIFFYDDAGEGSSYSSAIDHDNSRTVKWSKDGEKLVSISNDLTWIFNKDGTADKVLLTRNNDREIYPARNLDVGWIDNDSKIVYGVREITGSNFDDVSIRIVVYNVDNDTIDQELALEGNNILDFQGNVQNRSLTALAVSNDEQRVYFAMAEQVGGIGSPRERRQGIVEWEIGTINIRTIKINEGDFSSGWNVIRMAASPDNSTLAAIYNNTLTLHNQSDLEEASEQPDLRSSAIEVRYVLGENDLLLRRSLSPRMVVIGSQNLEHQAITGIPTGLFSTSLFDKLISGKSDAYAAAGQDEGFRIIDAQTREVIEQQNPFFQEGDEVIFEEKIYESLTDENDDRPNDGAAKSPRTWLDRGAINPLRMIDGQVGSRTTASDQLEVTVSPESLVNGLALLNVSAATVRVRMDDPEEGEVYDSGEIQMFDNSTVTDWYSFLFEPYIELTDLALADLPPYPGATITVTLTAEGAEAALGQLVCGSIFAIGRSQWGSSIFIEDFSRKERDEFGNFEIVERGFANGGSFDIHIDTGKTPGVRKVLSDFRATPAVFIGAENRPETVLYGYYIDLDVVLANPSFDECSLEIQALTQ